MSRSTLETESLSIRGGRIVTPEAVLDGGVRIEGETIAEVGEVERGRTEIDANGRLILPGLIDLHGDDIETHLHPRSGAQMDTGLALHTADRANVAAGITTKFHAIAFELDEEADRSPELATELSRTLSETDRLLADHRLHARCEVTQRESVDAVEAVIQDGNADLVSVMSHVPGKGQFRDVEAFREYYERSTNHSAEEATQLIEERGDLELETLRNRVDEIITAANAAGAVTASHDDEDPAEVSRLSENGVEITEYPITLETARRAAELGMTTAMGAPNLVRGESQWGNLETATAIRAGVLDVLVADYHPPSLLASVFVETGESLPERVRRVTANPAAAVGLEDRGRIETGARADLLVVDPEPTPTVDRAIVAGRPVYRAVPTDGGEP